MSPRLWAPRPVQNFPFPHFADLSVDLALFHSEQGTQFRARGAGQCDQGQGAFGARGHGSRQPAGPPAGRPAGPGSDRDRDQHAGRGRPGRQQRRLPRDRRHHAGDAAGQHRRSRQPRHRSGSQRRSAAGDQYGHRVADFRRSGVPHPGGGAGWPDRGDGGANPRQRLTGEFRVFPSSRTSPSSARCFRPRPTRGCAPSCWC